LREPFLILDPRGCGPISIVYSLGFTLKRLGMHVAASFDDGDFAISTSKQKLNKFHEKGSWRVLLDD